MYSMKMKRKIMILSNLNFQRKQTGTLRKLIIFLRGTFLDRFLYVQFINRDVRRDLLLNLLMVCLLLNVLFLRVSVCGRGRRGNRFFDSRSRTLFSLCVAVLLWCCCGVVVVLLWCCCGVVASVVSVVPRP